MRFGLDARLIMHRAFGIGLFSTEDEIIRCFESMRASEMSKKAVSYLHKSNNCYGIYYRCKHILRLINLLNAEILSRDGRRNVKTMRSVILRKRERFLSDYVRYWSGIGKKGKIRAILRLGKRLSPTVRAMAERGLTGCEIYTYCSVRFPQGNSRLYYYRTELKYIRTGDVVLVPVGENNEVARAQVVRVRKYTANKVPRPVKDTKVILALEDNKTEMSKTF